MPSAAHLLYIPGILLIGIAIGFVMGAKAARIVGELWQAYTEDPRLLPPHALHPGPGEPQERAIADYLAGMTDRFAMDEHAKIFDPQSHV